MFLILEIFLALDVFLWRQEVRVNDVLTNQPKDVRATQRPDEDHQYWHQL